MLNFSGKRPDNSGVKDGKLASCLDTPNYVSSQSDNPQFQIDPLPLVSIAEIKKLVEVMEKN